MSMSLDFKLKTVPRFPPPPLPAPPPPPTATEPLPSTWHVALRFACVLAVIPLMLLPHSTTYAASMHLLTMPITAYILQRYHHQRYPSSILYYILPTFCILLSNTTAVMLLLLPDVDDPPYVKIPLALLALLLTLAVTQQLWLVEKRAPPRLMLCTAAAMFVLALSYLGVWAPTFMLGRRFFQSTTLPLLLLLMETFRIPSRIDSNASTSHIV